jgi:hypothetical protein
MDKGPYWPIGRLRLGLLYISTLTFRMRLKLLAGKDLVTDTRFTYHRTWEKGLKPVTRVAGFNPQIFSAT